VDENTKAKLQGANAAIRNTIRNQLKFACPDLYAEYRSIKYPTGEGSDTEETRLKATLFLFDTAREIVAPHYVQTPKQLDAVVAAEDAQIAADDEESDEDESEESGD